MAHAVTALKVHPVWRNAPRAMLAAVGDVMRRCYDKGWITTRDGNCSVRRAGSPLLYVTPSGLRKADIHPEQLVKIELVNGRMVIPAGATPTGECHMHYRLLKDAAETRAVLHVHATHVVAAIYRGFDLPALCREFPELQCHTTVGATVPFLPPASVALGEAVAAALLDPGDGQGKPSDIVGLRNHGCCAIGTDPWAAYEHIERLDHICEIVLKSGVSPA